MKEQMNSDFDGLGRRARRFIEESGIKTLQELSEISEERILKHSYCGKQTVKEINWYLDTFFYNQ